MSTHQMFIGTYTASSAPAGRGEGIYSLTVDTAAHVFGTPQLVAKIESGSWLLHHAAGVLWAAREEAEGSVAAFKITDGATLVPLATSDIPTGAGSPCHLALSPAGDRLLAASYGDGAVTDIALTEAGEAARDESGQVRYAVHNHVGSGPNKDRQAGPHAHSATVAPDNEHVLVADLGTDELRRYDFASTGELTEAGIAAKLPGGAGPRHLAVSEAGFVYVTGELDNAVHIFRWEDDASATYLGSVPAGDPAQIGGPGDTFPGHLELSADGTRLWVANRGANIIATFAVEDGGMTLRHLADTPVGGENPRHFARVGDALIVGHQNTDSLALLPLNDDGVPGAVAAQVDLGSPVCIVPISLIG